MRPLTRVASQILIVATVSSWSRPPSEALGASPACVADLDGYVTSLELRAISRDEFIVSAR